MPRTPSLRRHSTGQSYVELNGRRIYLGKHGLPETEERYHALISEWMANGRRLHVEPDQITVVELVVRFMDYAEDYYRDPAGNPTGEASNMRLALRPVVRLYGRQPAAEFGPRAMKTVVQDAIDARLARGTINGRVQRIKRMIRWAIAEELVPAETLQRLQAVAGLRRGRSGARETQAITPAPQADVDAVLAGVSRQVAAIIRLQLLTAARSGEVVLMRGIDLDTSGPVWIYRPEQHKTAYRGTEREIYIGPQAQAVVEPFLAGRRVDAFLFSPAEAEEERRAAASAARKTPRSCGNVRGSNRKRKPRKQPGERYTPESYARAIRGACKRMKVDHWHPHQLRHSAATRLRREHGLEAAQLLLGHARADVTQVYAEANRGKAIEVAARVG